MRAEIYKQGVLHVPAGIIYIADFPEPSFQDRFGPPEWVFPNVLKLPGSGPVPEAPPDSVIVLNTSTRSYRSVRIETGQDMCLIIDLDARREQVLPMPVQSPSRRSAWFDLVIEAGTVGEFLRGSGTFEVRRGAGAAYTFIVNISDHGADLPRPMDTRSCPDSGRSAERAESRVSPDREREGPKPPMMSPQEASCERRV